MAFSINKFLNEESKKEIKSDWKPIRISVHKLRPAAGKENFYHIDDKEVEETARTIELVGIQQYPVVKPLEGTDEYEVIAGHKRRLAVLKLVEEGKTDYEMIPCKVEAATDGIRNELILIFTNSTQRSRTDYEKMQEIKRVKELLTEYQKNNELTGRKQNIIAEILGTSKTKVGTLENIDRNLIEQFKEEFAAGRISTNTANEIAGLDKEAQIALFETYKETGSLTAKDAKAVKIENEQVEGQMDIIDFPDCLPEDLQEEAAEKKQEQQEQPKPKEQEEVKVSFNQPPPDTTDKKSLIINGKINKNKEYNGMTVNYFMGAVINSDLFGSEFWEGWKSAGNKPEFIAEYMGTVTTYTVQTTETERCELLLIEQGLQVKRQAADQSAVILYEELAELIDVMIYTKVIEITTIDSDLKYWAKRTVKDLEPISNYLTESEIYVLQDIMMKCRERAGR